MKKCLLLMIVAAMITTVAVAQTTDQKDPKKDRTEWEKKVKDELKLTPEQVIKFDAVSKEFNEKLEAVAQDATLSKDVQKERKMALKKEKETKLFEFFTPEQQTRYRELIEQKKKDMGSKPADS
jgi:hypothetical protein